MDLPEVKRDSRLHLKLRFQIAVKFLDDLVTFTGGNFQPAAVEDFHAAVEDHRRTEGEP